MEGYDALLKLLGNRIKKQRIKQGYTLDSLAKKINNLYGSSINKGMISKWENSKEEPSLTNIVYLANTLNVDISYLVGSNNSNNTIKENNCDQLKDPIDPIQLAAQEIGYFKELSEKDRENIKLAIKIVLQQKN